MADQTQALNSGDLLGGFRIVRPLGEGGMGIVYLARDERLDRRVALKVIVPQLARDREFQRRFEAEAKSAAAIDDPHVVPVYSAGSAGGKLYIAMRYVEGTDLRSLLRDQGALEPQRAVAVVADVAAALDAAHAAGLVHRDVKPANILLEGMPGEGRAYLTDFGLTKGLQAERSQLTGTGQWIGTLDYVAPEQMTSGRVDARTDVYALGCVLYEMLAGSVPYSGNDMQKMWAHVNEPAPALGVAATRALDTVVARAMATEAGDRFPSAGDLAIAAAAAIGNERVAQPEHSVATGAAAGGLLEESGRSAPTRTMGVPAPRGERPTAPMSAPPNRTPPREAGRGGGSAARVAAVVGGCIVLAAGLIAAALVLAGGKGGESRTVVNRSAEPASEGALTEGPAAEEAPAGKAAPHEGAGAESSSSSSSLFAQSLYSVEIPLGWRQEEDDEPISNYMESTWHSPTDSSARILIDAESPASGSAVTSAEAVREQTRPSTGYREGSFAETTLSGVPAVRWVFDVSGDRRVDYFFYQCGVGLAVLGSTSPTGFGALAETFHEVASSVAVPCGE